MLKMLTFYEVFHSLYSFLVNAQTYLTNATYKFHFCEAKTGKDNQFQIFLIFIKSVCSRDFNEVFIGCEQNKYIIDICSSEDF